MVSRQKAKRLKPPPPEPKRHQLSELALPNQPQRGEQARVKAMMGDVALMRQEPEMQEVFQNIKWLIDNCERQVRRVST